MTDKRIQSRTDTGKTKLTGVHSGAFHSTDNHAVFNEQHVISELKHCLPSQKPLKNFNHHNFLHGFQNLNFYEGTLKASALFGSPVGLQLTEYRVLFKAGRINNGIPEKIIFDHNGESQLKKWKDNYSPVTMIHFLSTKSIA